MNNISAEEKNKLMLGVVIDAMSHVENFVAKSKEEVEAQTYFESLTTEEKLKVYREVFVIQTHYLSSPDFINPHAAEMIMRAVNDNDNVVDIRLAIYKILQGENDDKTNTDVLYEE